MSRQQTHRPADETWKADAACKGLDVFTSEAVFFPLSENKVTARKANDLFCGTCQVRQECLSTALYRREEAGIWAGATTTVRKRLMRNRTRIKCPRCHCFDLAVMAETDAAGREQHFSVCVACGTSWRMEQGTLHLAFQGPGPDPEPFELEEAAA